MINFVLTMKNVTDIIFDLGGVLIDLDTDSMFRSCAQHGLDPSVFFVPVSADCKATVYDGMSSSRLIADYQTGLVSSEDLLTRTLPFCPDGTTSDDIVSIWNACLGDIPTARLDLILSLRKQGYRTHLLSNSNDLHWRTIVQRYFSREGYRLSDLFDNLFLSHEMHLAKPDPAIYRSVSDALAVPADQIIFIDDASVNVQAALSEGWNAFWLDLKQDTLTDFFPRILR